MSRANRIKKILGISALVAMAIPLAAAPVRAASLDDRLAQIVSEYEEKSAVAVVEPETPAVISDDVMIRSGDWTGLARKYDNIYVSGDIADAPSPVRLASWWNSLGDQTLSDLIYMALAGNRDLVSARAKVSEARAALGISKSALLPWLDSTGLWTNSDTSKNTGGGASNNLYRLGVDASWEIDVFGGQRENIRASEADLAATHAALHSTWVSLSAEVAMNYLNLCTLYERLNIAYENLRIQNETLEMLQSQYDSGLADALALNQAQYTVEQTKATVPPINSSIESTMNALSILVGRTPGSLGEIFEHTKPIPKPDPINLVGIPAEGLRRRPDIQAAEMQFIAQTARTKSARADLYPKFHLIGSIGIESLSTGSLFDGDSYGFSIGPRITWPIFHGGAIRRNIQVQTAREEQYLAAYEQTVLQAVAEVRNALVANTQEQRRNAALKRGVDAARSALEVAQDKYRNGLTDFNNVIGAQAALLSLQDQQVTSEGQMASNIVQIFKALGGGWAPLVFEEMEAASKN